MIHFITAAKEILMNYSAGSKKAYFQNINKQNVLNSLVKLSHYDDWYSVQVQEHCASLLFMKSIEVAGREEKADLILSTVALADIPIVFNSVVPLLASTITDLGEVDSEEKLLIIRAVQKELFCGGGLGKP